MLAAVFGHDLQAWLQFIGIVTALGVGLRWLIRHYLEDLLAQSGGLVKQQAEVEQRLTDLEHRVVELDRKAAVLVDRTERPPFP